ncbi:MAG: hypothetical protein IKP87_05765 [Victivallales bacterium]|nr:hypothetical protein [Victivallales bacterium]
MIGSGDGGLAVAGGGRRLLLMVFMPPSVARGFEKNDLRSKFSTANPLNCGSFIVPIMGKLAMDIL